jgi:hypothetical protein
MEGRARAHWIRGKSTVKPPIRSGHSDCCRCWAAVGEERTLRNMNNIHLCLFLLPLLVVACAEEPVEEERVESTSALKCPSPVTDRAGFLACVKRSSSSSSGNGGVERAEANGGSIRIGDINATGCGSLSISCSDQGCTCSANGGPRQACNGNDCVTICCAK